MVLGKLFLLHFLGLMFSQTDQAYYRSPELEHASLERITGDYFIADDEGEQIRITAMVDSHGVRYWYRRIKTAVCLTGECRLVDVGLYWDCMGNYFGLDVYGEHLTKTDHSNFSEEDYRKLQEILQNDWSILREYDFQELTSEPAEGQNEGRADATSGATRTEIASEAVADAVYTTYTLWHLIHNGEKEQLIRLTIRELENDQALIDSMLAAPDKKFRLFLLELFADAEIDHESSLLPVVMEGLQASSDPRFQDAALKAMTRLSLDNAKTQTCIAGIYSAATDGLRLRMLTAMDKLRTVSDPLYSAVAPGAESSNEWFAAKVLDVLKHAPAQTPSVVNRAKKLSQSKNTHVSESAEAFLQSIR